MPREKVTLLALALAAGIALGWGQGGPVVWPWLAGAAVALGAAALLHRRDRRGALAFMAAATVLFGAAWVTVRQDYVAPDDVAAGVANAPLLMRVRGVALGPPLLRDRTTGSMGLFDHRPPATYFPLEVRALVSRDGDETRVRGRVLVRVEQTLAPFRAGDRVETIGLLYPPSPPDNPGAFNYQRYARSLGRAGMLHVGRRELVTVVRAPRAGVRGAWLRRREALRRCAGGWLLADLPDLDTDRSQRDALLGALLLGRRGPELDGLGESFRRAGLAHFLAISGLHLGVMAGFVLLLVRVGGRQQRWHGWIVIAAVLIYLVLVEVRMPVLRAGVMTIAACLGLVAGRRMQVGGLVAASAVGLLLWRPDQLLGAGFQLSYGVVLGLIHLAPLMRTRWFGRPDAFASSSAQMLGQWLRTTCAVAVTAWLVAMPIALYHWGVVWPLAAPFSVVVLPVVTAVLAVGYLKMLLALVLPSAALVLAVPLSLITDILITLVRAMDAVAISVVHVAYPPAAWAFAAEAWLVAWVALGARVWTSAWTRRAIRLAGVVLLVWLVWPLLAAGAGSARRALRIDMLAVGDGSCYVLRSGGSTVVFDAGSASDLDAGRRTIVPALRRLGVRKVDAVAVSHPNLDHYSAVLEIVDAFGARSVLVTPQFLEAAAAEPGGPVMFLLDELVERYASVLPVQARQTRAFGSSRWTWLHPEGGAPHERANEGSMVILIEAAGRRALLCGDIQRGAMEALASDYCGLSADVLELPHHGSHHRQAEVFLGRLAPRVVLQSTGRTRWKRTRERWEEGLGGTEHLVTARDGACWVEIDRDGSLRWGRYRVADD
ncbi:MAG: ComEC/Rec2 family competence protein [Planctomycetota bacterium]|jgi:competence protein ComEC